MQQVVFQEYVDTVLEARRRVAGLEEQMRASLGEWSLRSVVEGWMALRGVGLVPSEHSSGGRRRRGGITKTGNGHVRRVLVEAAWSYRFPARKTAHPRRKAQATAPAVQAIAWAAQKRLCARYWHLYHAGKAKCQFSRLRWPASWWGSSGRWPAR